MGGVAEAVGGVDDHVHVLDILKPSHCLSDVMRDLKKQATVWVRETNDPAFSWQEGYAVLSVGANGVPPVREYISSQAEHHAAVTFIEELQAFLREAGVPFDARSLS
jgi:putative transposase